MRRTLRQLRGTKSMRQFAAELGVTATTVYRWENGLRTPPVSVALDIAKRYGMQAEALWSDEVEGGGTSSRPAS